MDDNDRRIVTFVAIAHALVHTYELAIPILLVVWAGEFATTVGELATVVAVGYALFGLGSLPAGILADRYGSRRLVTVCLFGMGISFVGLSLAPGIGTLAAALVVWGAAASIYHPAGLSLISTGVRNRGRGFAYHGMAGNVGIAGGPLLTAVLLVAFDWRSVVAIVSLPAFLAAGYAITRRFDERAGTRARDDSAAEYEVDTEIGSIREFLAAADRVFTPAFVVVFVVVVFNGLYYRGALTLLPEILSSFLEGAPLEGVTPDADVFEEFDLSRYVYVGLLLLGVAGQYAGGRLTDVIDPERGLAYAFAGLTVVALAFVSVGSRGLGPLLVVGAAMGILLFVVQPLYQATVAEYSDPDRRGLTYGFVYVGVFGIGALGAAIAGVAYDQYGAGHVFVTLALFAVVASGASLFLWRRYRGRPAA